MGGLAHYLEEEGVPTTGISLIRPHTEKIKPPRALWVPFELGRPLGAPGDPAFQRRVLMATLELLLEPEGPVLKDFPDQAPEGVQEDAVWACPLPLAAPPQNEDSSDLGQAFINETVSLTSWYTQTVKRRGRTTDGASGLEPQEAAALLAGLLGDKEPPNPRPEIKLVWLAKVACEDIKAYYLEAAMAQPGNQNLKPGGKALTNWFFQRTAAGKVFHALRRKYGVSDDPDWKMMATLLMVPMSQFIKK